MARPFKITTIEVTEMDNCNKHGKDHCCKSPERLENG
jgi:hypothetical protein